MDSSQRMAGIFVLLGIIFAVSWRIIVAPAALGSFDPADMPHRDRAFLSIGNVGVAVLFAVALRLIAQLHTGAKTERLARIGTTCAAAAAAAAAVATIGLIWTDTASHGLEAYVVLMGIAWAISGYATFHRCRGGLGWAALVTGVIYAIAAVSVFAGAFIIFIMTVAAIPYAIALLIANPAPRGMRPEASSP